jgi:hypothetical protein
VPDPRIEDIKNLSELGIAIGGVVTVMFRYVWNLGLSKAVENCATL